MPRRTRSAARVRLARSLPRLLAIPLVLVAVGAALGVGGVIYVGGVGGWVLAGCGAALVVLAVLVAVAPFAIRVHVEESLVRVSWPLGRRQVYLLTPGSLTRIHLRGPGSARLRGGFGLLGWRIGDAQLEDGERIHLVRLAPTESMIMIPTASGRLGIATSNEPHLVEALMRAARARAARGELPEAMPALTPMTPEAQRTVAAATSEEPQDEAPEGVLAAATAAPETTDVEPETAAVDVTAEPGPTTVGEVEPAQRLLRRPSWARQGPSMPAVAVPALVPERVRRIPMARPKPSWLLLLVPLATAWATWGAAILMDRMPPTGTDEARLTLLGLVLAGPATTVGAIMARTWWPRVVEVVVIGGVAAAALIGRALLA